MSQLKEGKSRPLFVFVMLSDIIISLIFMLETLIVILKVVYPQNAHNTDYHLVGEQNGEC